MPTKARHRCVSCGNGVMSVKQACTHCGAPDPLNPGPIVPAIVRCAQCGHPTHVAAESCRKCRTPSGSFTANAAAPSFHESTEFGRVAAESRAISAAMGRQPSGGVATAPTTLAAPLWDPTRTPIDVSGASHLPKRPESDIVAAEKASIFPSLSVTAEPPTASLVNRVPCGRCGEPQPRGSATCGRCGVANPETAEPIERRKPLFGFVNIPTLPLVVTIVGLLALGGFTFYTQLTKEGERKQRVWLALGSKATEAKVAEVEKEAAYIGVSTDVLLRVRFSCLRRDEQRPSSAMLRQVRVNAERNGRDPGMAVSDAARSACGR